MTACSIAIETAKTVAHRIQRDGSPFLSDHDIECIIGAYEREKRWAVQLGKAPGQIEDSTYFKIPAASAPMVTFRLEIEHPNGRRIAQSLELPYEEFGRIHWREVEEAQMLGSDRTGVEVSKEDVLQQTIEKRRDTIARISKTLGQNVTRYMTDKESDSYSDWNK
ncbi:MAG: hypothetical protein COA62_15960 [Rhodobiaceae bacterium]|nr:MAG: hypothetical protein COA62_15960 [Rhodobiaceae bacterium]